MEDENQVRGSKDKQVKEGKKETGRGRSERQEGMKCENMRGGRNILAVGIAASIATLAISIGTCCTQ